MNRASPPPASLKAGNPTPADVQFRRDGWIALLLAALLFIAYQPAWHGKPIWDDDAHLTREALRSWSGLGRIWVDLSATQQYYPITHSVFWIQSHLWGDAFFGYHALNLLLHALSAWLLVRIFRRLELRGGWLAAALWALHPVQVESVAWMTELKNTLSGVFYLGSALLYLRYDAAAKRSAAGYLAALGLFLLGLWSKSVIATLPAALLLIFYWKRGRITVRDIRPLLPFFGLGIASGLFTAWVERTYIGAEGSGFHLSWLERCLVAGRAFWFYLGKLAWPGHLVFVYPRWEISAAEGWEFVPPLLVLLLLAVLFSQRTRWGRGPLVAVLYFAGTLFPALGFINVYPFRYSWVADHFQYLASIGPCALVAAGYVWVVHRFRPFAVAMGLLLAGFAGLTFRQSAMYSDIETLWRTTIAKNPQCWMAHNNLGIALGARGLTREAMAEFREAIRIYPAYAEARNNLGLALINQGEVAEAIALFEEAARLDPANAGTHNNLGNAYFQSRRMEEAVAHYREALRLNPLLADAHANLGLALLRLGKMEESLACFDAALRINPANADTRSNLGLALTRLGRTEEGIVQYRTALQINPNHGDAHGNLGLALLQLGCAQEAQPYLVAGLDANPAHAELHASLSLLLLQQGRSQEAIDHARKALEIRPDNAPYQNNLAWMLATVPERSLREGAKAVELALQASRASGGNDPSDLDTLAAAYAESGDFEKAVETAQRALKLAQEQGKTDLAQSLRRALSLYEAHSAFTASP